MRMSSLTNFRLSLGIAVFIVLCGCRARAQKYAYPYGVEAKGVAGAIGVDTLVNESPENRSADDIKTVLNIRDGTNVTKLVFFI